MPYPTTINNLSTNRLAGQVVASADVNAVAFDVNALTMKVGAGAIAPFPTGVMATDTANVAALLAANTIVQLQTGTYVLNASALNFTGANCLLRAWGGSATRTGSTVLQLANQSSGVNQWMIQFNADGCGLEGLILDGNGSSIGSGNYWSGLVQVVGGADDCFVRGCIVQNTARSGIYGFGYQTIINRLQITDTWFTNIGNVGPGVGGACIMFDGGCSDSTIVHNRAYGRLSSNFIKVKSNTRPLTSSGSTTSTLINFSGGTNIPNSFTGVLLTFTSGSASGQTRVVTSNTASSFTVAPAFSPAPTGGGGETFTVDINCYGNLVENNTLDYSACTVFDTTNAALGIELYVGAWSTRCEKNNFIGPSVNPPNLTYSPVATFSTTVQTISNQGWATSSLVGAQLTFTGSTTTVALRNQTRTVIANTATSLTTSAAFPATPVGSDTFTVNRGDLWGISCGDARHSTIEGNTIQGLAPQAIAYGIETAECPWLTVTGNTIKNVDVGMNSTNSNPLPSHQQTIANNTFENCYTYGYVSDSGPAGIRFHDNTLTDCGVRYIFLNSNGGVTRNIDIHDNSFMVRNQTRLDPAENQIFGIYVSGGARTDICPVDIHDNYYGPFPGGLSTVGMVPVEVNNPQSVRFHDNRCDGGRPSDGAATAGWCIQGYCYGITVKDNAVTNYTAGLLFADTSQINVVEGNDAGTLALGGTGGSGTANPTGAAGANAGSSPPAPVMTSGGTPRQGSLTFGTGTGAAAGAQVVVTFPWRMLTTPVVTLTARNTATQALGLYVSSVTNAGFTVSCTGTPAASQANTVYSVGWLAFVA